MVLIDYITAINLCTDNISVTKYSCPATAVLGGNGFYWRVAFSDAWPGAMELRRAEDGVRNWQTGDGESYHAFGGEYGGMWRRNGRPPNEVAGVGFAAQGFGRATHFDVDADSFSSRAAWIWHGVEPEDGKIGTSGLGGGAAGQRPAEQ